MTIQYLDLLGIVRRALAARRTCAYSGRNFSQGFIKTRNMISNMDLTTL